jgi:hypothetical protein
VRWGTDEEGRLVPVDSVVVHRSLRQPAHAVCPDDAGPGQEVIVDAGGRTVRVVVPEGVGPGEAFPVFVDVPDPEPRADPGPPAPVPTTAPKTMGDVRARVQRLQTPLKTQVGRAGSGRGGEQVVARSG